MSKLKVESVATTEARTVHITKEAKELAKDKLKELIQQETKMVRGIFQNLECPGGAATITVQKYPGVPKFTKTMTDGAEYEIPLYVARFLNGVDISAGALGDPNKKDTKIGTCSYPVHGFLSKGDSLVKSDYNPEIAVPIVGQISRKRRYGFIQADFAGE